MPTDLSTNQPPPHELGQPSPARTDPPVESAQAVFFAYPEPRAVRGKGGDRGLIRAAREQGEHLDYASL